MKTPLQKQIKILAAIIILIAVSVSTILCLTIPIGW